MSNLPFLKQLAQSVYHTYSDRLDDVTLVFPNRRAGLFFRKYLAEEISQPIWSPTVLSMEDFVKQQSTLQTADKFSLIAQLYEVYRKYLGQSEQFDQFYYWGEMLLGDFDDIDKYLIDAKFLLTDLSKLKELDDYFDYLTEEQRKIILEFWSTFSEKTSNEKKNFQLIWSKLYSIYVDFNTRLTNKNLAYTGLIYRHVANNLPKNATRHPIVFSGFNALTTSEEKIISHFLSNGAEIYWDTDAYYMDDLQQEAGMFIREHKRKKYFSESLKAPYDNNFNTNNSPIHLYATAQRIGQVKLLGSILNQLFENGNFNAEKTVIVLPDETLLFPVLNSLPQSIEKINVTMGFPLVNTPIYSLIEHLLDMQLQIQDSKNGPTFYFKHVLNVLSHPLIQQFDGAQINSIIRDIEKKNGVRLLSEQFKSDNILVQSVFVQVNSPKEIIDYMQKIIGLVSEGEEISLLEKEYAYQFYTQLNSIKEVIDQFALKLKLDAFIRLFKQIIRSLKLPFSGEPLNGLQVMGVLETRNLDFENVLILSMNEGAFPSPGKGHSFVPYNIRKAYDMPTFDQQDAIYAYLFYRLLQKAKNIYLFYTTETGVTGGGELSRYVQQLQHESDHKIVHETLSQPIAENTTGPIRIKKTNRVYEKLNKYKITAESGESQNRLTPSAINTYLDCQLRFYFRYVAELYEYNELQDKIDPMVFGNILHHAMEKIYLPFNKNRNELTVNDFATIEPTITKAVRSAFADHYAYMDKEVILEGRQVLAFEMIKKYVTQIIRLDKNYAPFEILGLEAKEYILDLEIEGENDKITIGLKGVIDRIDKKSERVRIIDYKTGKDDRKIANIQSLFDRDDEKRNKAGMQTLLYALLFIRNQNNFNGAITPGIFNTKQIFLKEFDYRLILEKEPILNAKNIMAEFEGYLKDVLSEIYSPYTFFDQTDDEKKCINCVYNGICGRG